MFADMLSISCSPLEWPPICPATTRTGALPSMPAVESRPTTSPIDARRAPEPARRFRQRASRLRHAAIIRRRSRPTGGSAARLTLSPARLRDYVSTLRAAALMPQTVSQQGALMPHIFTQRRASQCAAGASR